MVLSHQISTPTVLRIALHNSALFVTSSASVMVMSNSFGVRQSWVGIWLSNSSVGNLKQIAYFLGVSFFLSEDENENSIDLREL